MSGDKFDDEDDVLQLSAETLKALQEFYAESQAQEDTIKEDWVKLSFKLKLTKTFISSFLVAT